jgi:BlaI family transcriptional regulator, penicillinase repressor
MTHRARASMRPLLTGLEHDVMQAVWTLGTASVEAVHAIVSQQRDVKEVTTRTMLRRLEQKGHLTHDVAGRAYLYRAVEAPRSLAARAVRQIIDRLCRGSVEELVSGLVESKLLTTGELDALARTVRNRPRPGDPKALKSSKKGA